MLLRKTLVARALRPWLRLCNHTLSRKRGAEQMELLCSSSRAQLTCDKATVKLNRGDFLKSTAALAVVGLLPEKRLIVCDGIFGRWDWGRNPPWGWKSFGGRSPNCLLFGTDPVAMDSIICDHVTESLPEKVKDYPAPNVLVDAAKVGLGRHESRKNPQAGYKTIDYAEINQKVDEAKLHKLADLKKRYKSGGKTAEQIRDLLEECQALL